MNKAILSVQNLKVHFPLRESFFGKARNFVKAVEDVSFDIYKGESVGLIGESGSGKTTIAKGILRLTPHIYGKVLFEDKDIAKIKARELKSIRKDMQIIFQDPYSSLNPRMTIGSIVEEGLIIHNRSLSKRERQEKVLYILEKVGINKDFFSLYPHEFSGGQRQRIGIARALILNPKLVICDEPVSALDVSVQIQVLKLMMSLQKDFNLTYLFIAHDLAVVDYFCNRIIILYLGRIMEIGTRDDIIKNGRHPYTKALIEAIPKPDPRIKTKLSTIQGDIPSPINAPSGCVFNTRCPIATKECSEIIPPLKRVKEEIINEEHFCACIHV